MLQALLYVLESVSEDGFYHTLVPSCPSFSSSLGFPSLRLKPEDGALRVLADMVQEASSEGFEGQVVS